MVDNKNKRSDKEDLTKNETGRDNWGRFRSQRPISEDMIVDTLKPPPRIPDNKDNSDES